MEQGIRRELRNMQLKIKKWGRVQEWLIPGAVAGTAVLPL
jgi:hypothetical protein